MRRDFYRCQLRLRGDYYARLGSSFAPSNHAWGWNVEGQRGGPTTGTILCDRLDVLLSTAESISSHIDLSPDVGGDNWLDSSLRAKIGPT